MNINRLPECRSGIFLAPEYGGDGVSGGGHPADSHVPATEAIDDAFGRDAGHGKTAVAGVPGSRTNPVSHNDISQRAQALWEEEGRPDGKADDHWFRAEREFNQNGS